MRYRAICHIELSVLDYEASIAFYDRMFGYLGYASFSTLDVGYKSTYYAPSLLSPHSYIGIQPAKTTAKLDFASRPVGIHHVALWAKSREEVDQFHEQFLLAAAQEPATPAEESSSAAAATPASKITVTEAPQEYPHYAPGYYGVFFDDPINGIHWEVAHVPMVPGPWTMWKWRKAVKAAVAEHPDESVKRSPFTAGLRKLPTKKEVVGGKK